ncbi:YlbF family regulator [Microaerobacter geothermalis]|uniref:RicAFT regulatory complex protein RicA family protein n=1 Tax=Microaerobacter geothermalis TaxID=674972 RepID=UPI001F2F9B91|nr:YlbF family regulator [Microaerobacter geothermalis]MCF6093135.1 YlbF family regulator [Microaerobacter geothermalis]
MEVVNREQILKKAEELADLISNSPEVDIFKKAEAKIKINERVQTLISQIRKKQKQLVSYEHLKKDDLAKKVEEEIERLQDELDSIPIVQEFKQTQVDINDLLQLITNVIANTVSEKIIVSTGGNPITGETGGPKAHVDTACRCE